MSDSTADSPTPASPAAIVRLSGAVARVDAGRVTVSKLARTLVTDRGPVSADPADLGDAELTEPTPLLPGELRLGGGLPAVRVMPSCLAAARALLAAVAALHAAGDDGDAAAEAVKELLDGAATGVAPAPADGEWDPSGGEAPAPVAPGALPDPASGAPVQFTALDVETANNDGGAIIQIGLAVVRAGAVAETHSWYCRPPEGLERFDDGNVEIHGITPEQVADAPAFADLMPRLAEIAGGRPVVAHNARFDFGEIARACRAAGADAPELTFACTYMWARNAPNVQVENYRLPTLAEASGHRLEEHHDAAADAVACAEVALWLMRGDAAHAAEATTDAVAFSESLGLRMGSLGAHGAEPVRYLPGRGAAGGFGGQNRGGARGGNRGGARGGKGRGRGNGGGRPAWDRAKTPDVVPEANEDADPNGLLYGQNVTLTGDFEPYDKGDLWKGIAEAGGTVGKNVTKKTTILVAGPWKNVTSKEKRARELKEQGQDIDIWDEKQLFDVLGLDH
ncbi:exonuclease domain-containing protein [Corynebacterium sp. 335C]